MTYKVLVCFISDKVHSTLWKIDRQTDRHTDTQTDNSALWLLKYLNNSALSFAGQVGCQNFEKLSWNMCRTKYD